MKTINYLVLLCFFVASCSKEIKKETPPPSLVIGDPLDYGIENVLIFPVGTSYTAAVFEKEKDLRKSNYLYFSVNSKSAQIDRLAEIEYINEQENDFDIRNILFYDLLKGTSYKMVSDTIHILSFAIHKEYTKPLIFYRIVKRDFNHDKKYNSLDPVMLYVSDLDGKNLIQITPVDEHFIDYKYYAKTEKILVKTIIDSDNNKEFSNSDETNFVEMKISEPAFGKEIFSKALKDSLRVQINVN